MMAREAGVAIGGPGEGGRIAVGGAKTARVREGEGYGFLNEGSILSTVEVSRLPLCFLLFIHINSFIHFSHLFFSVNI